jgi:hypothetical protein
MPKSGPSEKALYTKSQETQEKGCIPCLLQHLKQYFKYKPNSGAEFGGVIV